MEEVLKPVGHVFEKIKIRFANMDPRIPVAVILFLYLVLGLTLLGFNRTPLQVLTTTTSCMALEALCTRFFKGVWVFPFSAMITSFSLSFLLNYSHDFFLLFVPVFFAIGCKYLITFRGRHALNPAMVGVSFSLLFSHNLITAAPAYQWNGIGAMSAFVLILGLMFVIPKVNRHWLVISFLFFFTIQTALRALIMRHHLPFETLFLGTLSSPSFLIFTFFMITDPATTPSDRKTQIWVGFWLAIVDLALHLRQSYYTFFYAALIVGAFRFAMNHYSSARVVGFKAYFQRNFIDSSYYKRPLILGGIFLLGTTVYGALIRPNLSLQNLNWHFEKIDSKQSGLNADKYGGLYEDLDPRIQHVAKWILSVGDSVAIADFDRDGKVDVFLTNMIKEKAERAALYRNAGDYKFARVVLPALEKIVSDPQGQGIISNAVFVDYDNDGDQDLFLTVGFGHPVLLKNMLKEKGSASFVDVTEETGLEKLYTNSLSATFADFNRDGLLDLLILNVWPENLPDYKTPQKLNLFHLPPEEYEGDQRPFNFMHDSWHMSNNGGKNLLLLQTPDHKFALQDSAKWGIPETRWSLAVGVVDFNKDGWPDIYIANDFGPDDLYYNRQGESFENIKGSIFGSIGKDTYKGMNVSVADFDRTGWPGVYVSDVHHAFQAEGSLLWMFSPSNSAFYPEVNEMATAKGVLNEDRFGWGGVATDFDNDGWVDLGQANGMVDDTIDKRFSTCPDYWYVNEKVARSAPSIHRYATKWGDLRGYCIYGNEQNRIYLNRGPSKKPQFVDAASELGVVDLTNSRGVASADFMNRGRRDLIFTHQFAKPTLYKNVYNGLSQNENSWIGFELESEDERCNREALGTRVELFVEKENGEKFSITQETQAVSGFSAQSDKRLHFGLGTQVKNVTAKVNWCLQREETYQDLKINQYKKIIWKNQ
ncbi:MAG: VCBS repeat-containing protein [Bdellovibrionaceae bacterium]|nr:VCBS repeat-containing protein [Pseudobdellovibrionaceae bacterium]